MFLLLKEKKKILTLWIFLTPVEFASLNVTQTCEHILFLHRHQHACYQNPQQGGQAGPAQHPGVQLPAPDGGCTQHQLLPSTGDV